MVILDSNAILRVVLKDNIEMENIVKKTLLEQYCLITVEVVAEVVYVLTKVYKLDRIIVFDSLKYIFEISNVTVLKKEIVFLAFNFFVDTNLSFVDSLLVSYSKIENYDVLIFDKELKKYLAKTNK
jgi:predicted nucleic-acid-binding protein